MKKIFYLLIPIILISIIIYGVIKIFILQDLGKGALQVTANPQSSVYLNNKFVGKTPLCLCEPQTMIQNGQYDLRIVPSDNHITEFRDKITISKGVLTVVDRKFGKGATSEGSVISLEPLRDSQIPELLVITFPDAANIYLDSDLKGKSPYQATSLTDSDHTLRVTKDGYRDKNIRIRTPAGYKLTGVIYLGLQTGDTTATPSAQPTTTPANTTPTPSVSPAPQKDMTVLILQTPNGFLRVRQEPSLDAPEIARVYTSETYSAINELNGWYEITLKNGTTGWISGQFAQKE